MVTLCGTLAGKSPNKLLLLPVSGIPNPSSLTNLHKPKAQAQHWLHHLGILVKPSCHTCSGTREHKHATTEEILKEYLLVRIRNNGPENCSSWTTLASITVGCHYPL